MNNFSSSLIAVILFILLNPTYKLFRFPMRVNKNTLIFYHAILFFILFYLANILFDKPRLIQGFEVGTTTPASVAGTPTSSITNPGVTIAPKSLMFQIKADGNSVPTKDMTGNYQITANDYVDGGGNHTAVATYNDPVRGNVLFLAHNYLVLNANTPSSCTRTFWVNIIPPQDKNNSFFVPYSSFVMSSQKWSLVLSGNSQNADDFKTFNVASLPCSLEGNSAGSFDISKMISSEQTRYPGKWYFVASVVTPLHHALYMYTAADGSSSGETPAPNTEGGLIGTNNNMFNCFSGDNGPVLIGARNNVANFGGYLDDIRQYNYALSEEEIVKLYNSTKK